MAGVSGIEHFEVNPRAPTPSPPSSSPPSLSPPPSPPQIPLPPQIQFITAKVNGISELFSEGFKISRAYPPYEASTYRDLPSSLRYRPYLTGENMICFAGISSGHPQYIEKHFTDFQENSPAYFYIKYYAHVSEGGTGGQRMAKNLFVRPALYPDKNDHGAELKSLPITDDFQWVEQVVELDMDNTRHTRRHFKGFEFGVMKFELEDYLVIDRFAILQGVEAPGLDAFHELFVPASMTGADENYPEQLPVIAPAEEPAFEVEPDPAAGPDPEVMPPHADAPNPEVVPEPQLIPDPEVVPDQPVVADQQAVADQPSVAESQEMPDPVVVFEQEVVADPAVAADLPPTPTPPAGPSFTERILSFLEPLFSFWYRLQSYFLYCCGNPNNYHAV